MAAVTASFVMPVAPVRAFKTGKTFKSVTVSNATVKKVSANMMVWTPINNK